jgi:hypothetical protein
MTVGAGLYLPPNETDQRKQNAAIRQLIEGRSNAVGLVTLEHDGVATTTTVTAVNCGPNAIPFLEPVTANAALARATTYVLRSNVTPGQFIITHAATANADETFAWVCLG